MAPAISRVIILQAYIHTFCYGILARSITPCAQSNEHEFFLTVPDNYNWLQPVYFDLYLIPWPEQFDRMHVLPLQPMYQLPNVTPTNKINTSCVAKPTR